MGPDQRQQTQGNPADGSVRSAANPRRTVLAAALRVAWVPLVLLLAACSREAEPLPDVAIAAPATEEPLLVVYNWAEYIAPEALQSFERETGIKIVYDTYDGNETLAEQLGRGHYDLVFPSARPWAARFVAEARLRKLDKGSLDGLGRIDAEIAHGIADVDPGNLHLVPYLWGTTGLAVDVAAVRERLGSDAPHDSWDLLFDPRNAAALADCGITIVEDMTDVVSSALIAAGRNTLEASDDDLAAAAALLAGIRPHVAVRDADVVDDTITEGTSCLVLGYSGDLARARAEAAAQGRQVDYVIPREGAVRWVDVMAIPADAPHPGNAHRFINHLLRPEVIAQVSNELRYANANVESVSLLDESLRNDRSVFPDPDVAARLSDAPLLPDDRRARWRALWNDFKASPQDPAAPPG